MAQSDDTLKYTPIETTADSCRCPCEPDFSIFRKMEFEITEKRKKYRLRSTIQENKKFLSKRSTLDDIYTVSEPSFLKLTDVKVTFKGDRLDKSRQLTFIANTEDAFFSENRIRAFKLPENIKIGDSLSVSYKAVYDDIAFFPIIKVENTDYIKELIIVIKHPTNLTIEPEIFFPRDSLKYVLYQNSTDETVIRFTNVCKSKEIPYFIYNDVQAHILISVIKNGRHLTPTTPASFVEWYASKTTLTPTFEANFRDSLNLEMEGNDNAGMVEDIYDYVRQNIRYIGDNRPEHAYIPYEPETVLSRKYGDCKDRASLVSALARKESLEVLLAVVSSHPDKPFLGIHPGLFNHVISVYINGIDTLFFDPTSRYSTFGNLSDILMDRFVVIMEPSQSTTTTLSPIKNRPLVEISITVDLSKLDSAKTLITFMNGWQGRIERALNELNDRNLQYFLDSLITSDIYKISFGRFKLLERTPQGIRFESIADLQSFVIFSQSNCYIPPVPFVSVDRSLIGRQNDDYAIHFEESDRINLNLRLKSDGYHIQPETIELGSEGLAYFKAVIGHQDTTGIELSYVFDRPRKSIANEDKRIFIDFCRAFLEKKAGSFILTGRNK